MNKGAGTRRKPAGRWGTGKKSNPEQARRLIIDAARTCFLRLSINQTAIIDIANEAKITRPTVYRYFPCHGALVEAVLKKDWERLIDEAIQRFAGCGNTGLFLADLLFFIVIEARNNEQYALLFSTQAQSSLPDLLFTREGYLAEFTENILKIIREWEKVERAHSEIFLICEFFNRMAVSYMASRSITFITPSTLREYFLQIFCAIATGTLQTTSGLTGSDHSVSSF